MSRAPRARASTLVVSVAVLASVLALGASVALRSARGAAAGGGPPPGDPATVVAPIDGDTIKVRRADREVTVRLIGIDTPETKRPGRPVECFGPEAAARTAALLPPGTAVVLEGDVEPTDRYDRQLAYVHRRADGLFVNLELARTGYAASYPYPPNVAHLDELEAA